MDFPVYGTGIAHEFATLRLENPVRTLWKKLRVGTSCGNVVIEPCDVTLFAAR
jgi:hypothetical protein